MPLTSAPAERQGSPTLRLRSAAIRERAKQLGFGRTEDMAREFGLSRAGLSNLLNHHNHPSTPTALRMATKLRWLVEDLYETEKGGE